jgi:hypothetical protein
LRTIVEEPKWAVQRGLYENGPHPAIHELLLS